jgi:hypothetical protein
MENPSNTGTACVTPSPESKTMPVVRPEAYLRQPIQIERGWQEKDNAIQRQNGLYGYV